MTDRDTSKEPNLLTKDSRGCVFDFTGLSPSLYRSEPQREVNVTSSTATQPRTF